MTDRLIRIVVKYKEWLVLTLALDLIFCIFLWLQDAAGFYAILPSVILATIILYGCLGVWLDRKKRR